MSAPLRDPLTVSTQDGSSWWRRAYDRQGHGLYAHAESTELYPVLRTIRELSELGLRGMTNALPVPVGGGLLEVERLRAQVAAVDALKLPESLKVGSIAPEYRNGYVHALADMRLALELPDAITQRIAPTQALARVDHSLWEDPHDSPLHHPYTVSHDLELPESGGQR